MVAGNAELYKLMLQVRPLIANQNAEQIAWDHIDAMLITSGWLVQSKKQINVAAGKGVAVREDQTDIGPTDYILFVNKKPVGVIEAKREEEGVLAPLQVWQAYNQLEKVNGQPKNELIALVSLIRKVSGMDATLTSFDKM